MRADLALQVETNHRLGEIYHSLGDYRQAIDYLGQAVAFFDGAGHHVARRVGEALNRRAMEVLPYIPLGFYWQPSVWRRNVTGVFRAPATVFWNMGKA